MKKMVALLVIGTVLVAGTGCRAERAEQQVPPPEQSAPTTTPADNEPEALKPLELPLYEVGGKDEPKVPMAKLGETLEVGPVRLTVVANSLLYMKIREKLPDGSLSEERPDMPITEFHVTIENHGDGVLDLHPRKAYWIADKDNLRKKYGFDPMINWFVAGFHDGGRYLILPDQQLAEELRYQDADKKIVKWIIEEKGLRMLPETVLPGQTAAGSIVFTYMAHAIDSAIDYYLCFGNWVQKRAWACVQLGTMEDLLEQAVQTVGPNPPRPWSDEHIIITEPGD
ncbi:hypothetical protein [Thermaerobacter litoralis]